VLGGSRSVRPRTGDGGGSRGVGLAGLVIAHVSDLHFGAHSQGAAVDLVADVLAAAPTVTVVTGDLTMRARPAQFRQARAVLDQLPRPLLAVLGNHDIPLLNLGARLAFPYRRYRTAMGDALLDPVLDLPGVRVQGLGSMPRWRWKAGRVSRRQSALVADVLGTAPPDALRVLALHHPPWQRGVAPLVGRGRLLRTLAAARVDLVLAGHTHHPTAQRVVVANGHALVDVVAGTATSTRTRGTPQSWTLIRAEAGEVTVEHRYYSASGWGTGEVTRFMLAG
jgi:3',5'-cyclic AMP phosphodiesterase CpdA